MNRKRYSLLVILFALYVCLSAGGLILFKMGAGDMSIHVTSAIFSIQFSWKMILGIVCYGCSFILWLVVVSKMNLSIAMPLSVGIVNVLVLLGSLVFLGETVTVAQWIGVGIVFIGLAIINMGGLV